MPITRRLSDHRFRDVAADGPAMPRFRDASEAVGRALCGTPRLRQHGRLIRMGHCRRENQYLASDFSGLVSRGDAMMAREGGPPHDTDDLGRQGEVLSSHPGEKTPRRRKTSVVVIALMLPAGLSVHQALDPNPSGTAQTSSRAKPSAQPSPSPRAAKHVAWVRTGCPRVRLLRLGDVDTRLFVEVAPCSSGSRPGPITQRSGDGVSIRFGVIVGVPPVTGSQSDRWIEVRCPNRACSTPQLLVPVTDSASTVVH